MLEFSHLLAEAAPGDSTNMVAQIATQMGVDLPKLLSQVFLFGVVIFALKKFAFGPVQKVLADREKLIEQSIENSEKIRLELAATESSRKETLKKAEQKAAEIIKQAQVTAEKIAQQRLVEATKEAEQIATKSRAALQVEQARMESELRSQITRLVAEATQKVTGKILTPEDHQRLNAETLSQVSRN
jgi:F-type H+-transporting ATPase subunit b